MSGGMRQGRRAGGGRGAVAATVLLSAAALLPAGCAPASGPMGSDGPGAGSSGLLLPAGYGSLRQDEITLGLRQGALQLKVTPLEEWVIRLTAPDTYDRLSGLASSHRSAIEREIGVERPTLFLVSFFSEEPSVTYDPEDVQLLNRGRRYRPLHIRPVTSGWGTQRLGQRETRTAVYAFPTAVDLDAGLVLEYGPLRNLQWDGILQALQSEHARVRARVRLRPRQPSSSSPNRLILR